MNVSAGGGQGHFVCLQLDWIDLMQQLSLNKQKKPIRLVEGPEGGGPENSLPETPDIND